MKQILTFFLLMSWFNAQGMENLDTQEIKKAYEYFGLPTNASKADMHAAYEIKRLQETFLHIKLCVEMSEMHTKLMINKNRSNDNHNEQPSPELEQGKKIIKAAVMARMVELKQSLQRNITCPYPVSHLPSSTSSSLDIYSPSVLQQTSESNCLVCEPQSFALDNWALNTLLEERETAPTPQPPYYGVPSMPYTHPPQH